MPRSTADVITLRSPLGRCVALLLAALLVVAGFVTAPQVRAAGGDGLREAANGYRVSGGLTPVVGTPLLDDIAGHRAAQMVEQNRLEHDLDYVGQRLNASGVCWSLFGEIIAWERGYPDYSYDRTMKAWWTSDDHRKVMMGAGYNAAGGAWDTASDGAHYSVMVFVVLCGDSVTGTSAASLYPQDRYNPDRELVLKPGQVTGFRLGRDGQVLGRKTIRLSETKRVKTSGRARANGSAWLKANSGSLDGYWVRETTTSFVRGRTELTRFDPTRQITVGAGRYYGFRFDWVGRVDAQRRHRFFSDALLSVDAFGVFSGRRYYHLSSGPLAGYWIRDTKAVDPV